MITTITVTKININKKRPHIGHRRRHRHPWSSEKTTE